MHEDATIDGTECEICCCDHDEAIHDATLSVHKWFHYQVTKYLYDPEELAAQIAQVA